MYPQMLHTTSQNLLRKPRFIRNGQVRLKSPMRFDRSRREDLSAVERCALRNLELEQLEFLPPSEGAADGHRSRRWTAVALEVWGETEL